MGSVVFVVFEVTFYRSLLACMYILVASPSCVYCLLFSDGKTK